MNNKEVLSLNKITKARLRELCKKHKLYQTPYLNDQLYLHYQGFEAIENLEEYTGLKCLWLESNAISEIQGIDCQPELKCLFLQNNLIKKIENLQSCLVLDTLNLASNHITRVENCGVDVLPVLSTLNLSRNYLRNSEGLRELVNCRNLWSLDLSHNRIDDILVVKIFANMPELRVLVLQGNPVVSQVPQYRKTLILECKNLTYLDSRPVFPKDRACAEAWKLGGYEEERKENERWLRADRKKIRDSVNATLRLRQKQGSGDVQLLESTDDEEENSKHKKLNKIPEEIINTDLEISGVDQANKIEDHKSDIELRTSESSLADSSDFEAAYKSDEEPNAIEIEDLIDIQKQPNEDQVATEDISVSQSQYLDKQVEVTNEEEDLVSSGDTISISKPTGLHYEEAKCEIEPTVFAIEDITLGFNNDDTTQNVDNEDTTQSVNNEDTNLSKPNSVVMRSATSFSQPAAVWNESTTLVTSLTLDSSLASDSSLSDSSKSNDTDATEMSYNTDNILDYMLSEESSRDCNLNQKYEEKEAAKSAEDMDSIADDAVLTHQLTLNISSESQFADSELSLQSLSTSTEEEINKFNQTFEIGTQGELRSQHSTFSELVSLTPTLETDRNLCELEDFNAEDMQTISNLEDSGLSNISNSVDASERMLTSNEETEGLPGLENISSEQKRNEERKDSKMSVCKDIIFTELGENEANRANEDKDKTTDVCELDTDSFSQSDMLTSSKANTLSSSLFVENSDEENASSETLDELYSSSWLDQILGISVKTLNQERFLEKIEEEVLSDKTEDSASIEEKSYQSDGSSLLEYILNISSEKEHTSSLEMLIKEIEDEKACVGNDEDGILYEDVSLQALFTTNEETKSPSEEMMHWVEKDEDRAPDEKISLEDMLAKIERNEEQDSISAVFAAEEMKQWLEKDEERTFDENVSLQHLLATLPEEKEDKLPSEEFNRRRVQLQQWLGENEDKVEADDEDGNIYIQSVDDDDESLSSMFNTTLGLNEDNAFEEDYMLQSILNKIEEEGDEPFILEASNEDSETIEKRFGKGKDKAFEGISDGSGLQNSFSCSSPYEEVFDNKHLSLMHTVLGKKNEAHLEDCRFLEEEAEQVQQEVLKNYLTDDDDGDFDENTVTPRELDSGDNMSSNVSWWERTLAAARESSDPLKVHTIDDSFNETVKQTQTLEDEVEASSLLEHILSITHENKVEIQPNQTAAPETPSNDANDDPKPPTNIRDVLSSFNKVAESIATTRYLTAFALAKDFSTESSDQINRHVEEMNREQRRRVSQMIDRVFAQKDKYDDNPEVVDGRLMVAERSTGRLEELPPLPPTSSSKYTSCGVSTTRANCNDNDSDDDYGTALSEDEPDDDDAGGDIEQHASDTKIKKIPYLSAVYGNESSTSTAAMRLNEMEDNCHRESSEQKFDSNHKVTELCNEIDAVVFTEWLENDAVCPAERVTTEKGNGEETASLMRELCGGTTDLSCRSCK